MLIFILKALVGKLRQYISSLLTYCTNIYNTRSTDKLLLKMLIFHTEIDLLCSVCMERASRYIAYGICTISRYV